jgi:hypothetical protein
MEIGKALDLMDRLSATREKLAQLEHQLRRSLILTDIFGGQIWQHGSVSTQVVGNPRDKMSFALVHGPKRVVVDLLDIPTILWPKTVVADIMACHGLHQPYLQKLKAKLKEET